ncbi:helix-turn-helix domain-containing protein [Natronococcus sp.]|uniref:helix-turn-helix domain-containing protein n=1 Tax=Natronococcus sp. TaxID=35747 RepID=UPI003A4DF03C
MTDVDDADQLRVSVTVSDVESVRDALAHLAELDATIEPERLSVSDPDSDEAVEVDLGAITPKQLEALELAYVYGYYRRPRETDLAELAAELGVSKSAVSQRLCAAESKLVTGVIGGTKPWLVALERSEQECRSDGG